MLSLKANFLGPVKFLATAELGGPVESLPRNISCGCVLLGLLGLKCGGCGIAKNQDGSNFHRSKIVTKRGLAFLRTTESE